MVRGSMGLPIGRIGLMPGLMLPPILGVDIPMVPLPMRIGWRMLRRRYGVL